MGILQFLPHMTLALLALCLWQLWDRRQLRKALEAADSNGKWQKAMADGCDTELATTKETLGTIKGDLALAEARATDAEAKTLRYYDLIDGACKQRDQFSKMYQAMATQHGAAQDLMLRTIEVLSRQLQALGKQPKIPSVIKAVRDEFFETHVQGQVTPVQDQEKKAIAKADQAP